MHRLKLLIDRPQKAWIQAAADLNIEFIAPNGEEYEVPGLLPEFGTSKGVIITDRKVDDEVIYQIELSKEYYTSGLNPRYYDNYNRK